MRRKCYSCIPICFLSGSKEQTAWIKGKVLSSVKGNKHTTVNQALWQPPYWIVQKSENYLPLHLLAEISNWAPLSANVSKQTHHNYLQCTRKLPSEIAVEVIMPSFLKFMVHFVIQSMITYTSFLSISAPEYLKFIVCFKEVLDCYEEAIILPTFYKTFNSLYILVLKCMWLHKQSIKS